MKEVKAYIAKHKLGSVTRALHKVEGLTGVSVIECGGYGRGLVTTAEPELGFHPGVKLEVICRDDLVDAVVNAIEKAAHTGLKSDGKIYVASIKHLGCLEMRCRVIRAKVSENLKTCPLCATMYEAFIKSDDDVMVESAPIHALTGLA